MFNFFVEGHAYVICVYHVKASLKKQSIYLSIYLPRVTTSVCYFLTMQIVTLLFFYKNKTLQIQANDSAPEVNTTSGTIVGKLDTLTNGKTVYEYLGIPYAEAPLKEYRWAAPRPPQNWTGTKETKEFGAACPQPEFNIPNLKREKRNGKMNKVLLAFDCHWKCVKAVLKGD